MDKKLDAFKIYDSDYGPFILNQYNRYQPDALTATRKTHIEDELNRMYSIIDTLPDDAILIDAGANIGFVTVPLARRLQNKNSTIISFEAQKRLFYALAGTIAINNIYNVHVYNQALGERVGVVGMPDVDYQQHGDYGTVSIISNINEFDYTNNNNTKIVTVDSLNLPRLDFIKIDVEGYEPNVIIGGKNAIKQHRPWLWVEYNTCRGVWTHEIIKEAVNSVVSDYSYWFIEGDDQNMICVPNEKLWKVNIPYLTKEWAGIRI